MVTKEWLEDTIRGLEAHLKRVSMDGAIDVCADLAERIAVSRLALECLSRREAEKGEVVVEVPDGGRVNLNDEAYYYGPVTVTIRRAEPKGDRECTISEV